jgi:hypothetical protein
MEPGPGLRRALAATMLLAGVTGGLPGHDVPRAHAYEFEMRARTIGQGYALRSLRLLGPSVLLPRRRFTQILGVDIFDIGELRGPRLGPALYERPYPPEGPHVYFSSYLRIDHDFGDWGEGRLVVDNRVFDAVDLVPELEGELLDLEVLYAYAGAEGLAGGWLDLEVGRQLQVGVLEWWSMDGFTARIHAPPGRAHGHAHAIDLDIELFGGLRVRDASPAASAATELDGTGSGECAEYVEGAVPGSGAWRPIDVETPVPGRNFDNDYDVCPQREQAMPTFGGALEASHTRGALSLWGRAEYRRSMSESPGLIGPVDRFANEDTGFYPDELGQTPAWGTNEERVGASVRATLGFAGPRGQISPHASAGYDLLTGSMDEAHAGVRLRHGMHAIEPELYYTASRFDGDSIFNVFAIDPYTDARLSYDLRPDSLPVSGHARTWARRFRPIDGAHGSLAGGVQLGAGYRRGRAVEARLDVFHEDGHGGRRTGGYGAAGWQLTPVTGVRGRVAVVDTAEDGAVRSSEIFTVRDTAVALQAGASFRINAGIMFHVMAEHNVSRFDRDRTRVLGLLDLAFLPETP